MIICTNCGFENDDDSRFCGGCQEFLDWTGEAIETDDDVETEPVVEEDEAHRGIVERVVDRIRGPEEEPEGTLPDSTAPAAATGPEAASEDPATAIASETAERAERDAEAAEQQRREAEQRAREQTEATERARAHAEQAEKARREAEDLARQEAEAAERIRAELEAARTAREEAESQLQQEAQAAEQAREAAERQRADTAMVADEERQQTAEAERARADAATRLQAEREAMEQAEADLEQAEAARRAAEARARAESDAAEAARQASAEAEAARLAAEEKVQEEARVAEQARRAAALVARPRPAPSTTEAEDSEQAPAPERTRARQPARRSRRRRDADAPTTPSEAPDETPPPTTGPAPVKPDRTRVRPVAKAGRTAPERRLRPGDLVCGQCGEGNTPTRNFCRRCGNTLAEAEVVRQPWWKRLVPRRREKVYAAGARPSRGQPGDAGSEAAGAGGGKGGGTKGVKGAVRGAQGLKRKILGPIGKIGRPLMFVGIALAAVGITFNPGLRGSLTGGAGDLFDRVRGFIAPQFEPVIPVDVTASSSLADHPPERAIDNTSDRWWAEGAEGNGEGESLVVTFAEPVDIAAVGVTPGAAETEEFVAQPRPRQLHLVFDTGVTADLDLSDEHEFQSFEVDAPGVTSVEVQVIEVWQGQSGSDMAITTLEFRTAS